MSRGRDHLPAGPRIPERRSGSIKETISEFILDKLSSTQSRKFYIYEITGYKVTPEQLLDGAKLAISKLKEQGSKVEYEYTGPSIKIKYTM